MESRVTIARESIMNLRKKYGIDHEKGVVFGCIGLLDYIETGDIDKIMHPNIRREVQKVNRKEECYAKLQEENQNLKNDAISWRNWKHCEQKLEEIQTKLRWLLDNGYFKFCETDIQEILDRT